MVEAFCWKNISKSTRDTTVQLLSNEEDTMTSRQHGPGSDQITPGLKTPLLPIKKLCSTKPSPLLAVYLIDILYTYCFSPGLYNGDFQSDLIGASMVVLNVSSVLGPESVSEALYRCLEQTCSPTFRHMGGLLFGLELLDNVIALVSLGVLLWSFCFVISEGWFKLRRKS